MGIDAQMVFVVPNRPSEDQLVRWSWDMVARLGKSVLWLTDEDDEPRPVLRLEEDERPSGVAADGFVVDVSLFSRHYGKSYERGDPLAMCAVAEWIEANIADAVVYYGTDHHESMWLWSRDVREELKRHFYGPNGIDYHTVRWFEPPPDIPLPPPCKACVPGEKRMTVLGTSGKCCDVRCYGCCRHLRTKDGGASWIVC